MKKVGLLFGSFNPIHIGHTALANYICEFNNFDELWLVVTPQNPLKKNSALVDAAHRLAMVRLATAFYPKFQVCDIEFSLEQPNYTINTLDILRSRYPQLDFYFIIGADNWQQLPRWRSAERFWTDYKMLIYPRPGYEVQITAEQEKNVRQITSPLIEVSSSFIREAFGEGKNVCEFVHQNVYEYICEHRLYEADKLS